MKLRYGLVLAALLLVGAGCTANSGVTTDDNGINLNGAIDTNGSGNGY